MHGTFPLRTEFGVPVLTIETLTNQTCGYAMNGKTPLTFRQMVRGKDCQIESFPGGEEKFSYAHMGDTYWGLVLILYIGGASFQVQYFITCVRKIKREMSASHALQVLPRYPLSSSPYSPVT